MSFYRPVNIRRSGVPWLDSQLKRSFIENPNRRVITYEMYLAKYTEDSPLSDDRGCHTPPYMSYEEFRDYYMVLTSNEKVPKSRAFRRLGRNITIEKLEEFFEVSRDEEFPLLYAKYWKKFYSYPEVFERVFPREKPQKQKSPIGPLLDIFIYCRANTYRGYSTLSYKWNDILAGALSKFINRHEREYIPFTPYSRLEYFYNAMQEICQEMYMRYSSETFDELWEEIYRFSWLDEEMLPSEPQEPPEEDPFGFSNTPLNIRLGEGEACL